MAASKSELKEEFEAGQQFEATAALSDAVHRYLDLASVENVLQVMAEACRIRAALPDTPEGEAERWVTAAEAVEGLVEDDEIRGAP